MTTHAPEENHQSLGLDLEDNAMYTDANATEAGMFAFELRSLMRVLAQAVDGGNYRLPLFPGAAMSGLSFVMGFAAIRRSWRSSRCC